MTERDDDYLWDGSGPVDEDVARLERLLGQLAAAPDVALRPLSLPAPVAPIAPTRWTWVSAAAVALLAFAVGSRLPGVAGVDAGAAGADPWRVARVAGRPTLAAAPLTRDERLRTGQWVETDPESTAVMFVGSIGRLEVAPGSLMRVMTAEQGEHRAELVRGTVEAMIWAPPGQFVIETPSATAVDLGCAYTLTVDEDGVGHITVQGGWVGFEFRGREAFIPAGATGRTYPGRGPGTPVFEDAPASVVEAVARLDLADSAATQREPLAIVLRDARSEDALTLWHLIDRVDAALVPQVVDRLHVLVPMPAGVTRTGVLTGDRAMRDAWWGALGLGSADWWRTWRQKWNPDVAPRSARPSR